VTFHFNQEGLAAGAPLQRHCECREQHIVDLRSVCGRHLLQQSCSLLRGEFDRD